MWKWMKINLLKLNVFLHLIKCGSNVLNCIPISMQWIYHASLIILVALHLSLKFRSKWSSFDWKCSSFFFKKRFNANLIDSLEKRDGEQRKKTIRNFFSAFIASHFDANFCSTFESYRKLNCGKQLINFNLNDKVFPRKP